MKKLLQVLFFLPFLAFAQTIELKGVLSTGNSGTDVWEYVNPSNSNVYAIVGGNGMSVVDVTDPANPVQVAHLTNVPGFDVKVWDHYAYLATSGGGTGIVVDIIDPTNPQIVGNFPSPHNIYIDERGYMYNSSPGVRIYDLNPDPTNPQFLIQVGSEGHDVTVRGNLMIDTHGSSGTNLYDVTDPSSPILLSSITDPTISYHHQGDISDDGNYLYINDELASHPQADISVWDISDITNPVRVGEFADPNASTHNIYVIGDYGYSSFYTAGFRVFDLSDPSQLVLADEYDTNSATGEGFSGAFGVYPSPETFNIYINDGSGVYIFGFSELGNFAQDVGVNNIVDPSNGILSNAEVVEITIRNFGLNSQSNIPLELLVDGNIIATENFVGTLNSGETATYIFSQTLNLSNPGQTYVIEARTVLPGDESLNNNEYVKEVTHLLNNDVGVLDVVSPVTEPGLGQEIVTVTIKNFGALPQSNFDVQYILNGAAPVIESFSGTINSEEEVDFSFIQTADLSELGTYTFIISTSLSGDGNVSNDSVETVINHVLCQPQSDCSFGDGFQLFSIAEIDNVSGCEGYGDFTALSANLEQGATYGLTMTTGYGDQHVNVWIDFNDDFDYTPNELILNDYIIAPGQAGGTYTETVNVSIPSGALVGTHRMRAKTNWQSPVPDDACEETQFGETEDYTAEIGTLGQDDFSASAANVVVLSLPNNQFEVLLNTAIEGEALISVFNMLGQEISGNRAVKGDIGYNLSLDLSGTAAGVYLIRASVGSNVTTTDRIIVR